MRTLVKRGLSSEALRVIAMVIMVMDHFAVAILFLGIAQPNGWTPDLRLWYDILRDIGRIAFPIFCFKLALGCHYTSSAARYGLRLALCALISEIPADLAIKGPPFAWGWQNVFFTLLLGFLAIICYDRMNRRGWKYGVIGLIGSGACIAAGWLFKTDYGAAGVALIFAFYLVREFPPLSAAVCIVFCLIMGGRELWGIAAVVPILLYDGRLGFHMPRWLSYGFYPAHLLLLWLLRIAAFS